MPISIPSGRTLPLQSKAGGGFRSLGVGDGTPGAVDWTAILKRTGPGTADATFNPSTDINYIGSFRVPFFSNAANPTGLFSPNSIAFKAPDANNGLNGSVFIGHDGFIAEVDIPALSTVTNHLNLNPATIRQNWVNAFAQAPTGNANTNDKTGWLKLNGGKLYMSGYDGYDTDGNVQNILVCDTPVNLSTATYQGFVNAYNQDHGGRYICDIPADKQATFGHTHFCGISAEPSIVGRASLGNSLLGISLASVNSGYSLSNTTVWAHYPLSNPIQGYSTTNGDVADYYAAIVNPPGRFNINDYVPQYLTSTEAANLAPDSLSEFTGVPVSVTGRETTLEGIALPAPSLRMHAVQDETVCGCAFIPPGTNTVVFLGYNEGSRYGQGYKAFFLEDGPETSNSASGWQRIVKTDTDNFIWTMNLNDVANRANVYDPQYSQYGIFEDPSPFTTGILFSGAFDPTSGKLYLAQSGYSFSQFESQVVISVYQIGVV
jgi:hypothetical protein